MLPRTLEPEVMDSAEEAREYDAMGHSAVNEAFVDDFLEALRRTDPGDSPQPLEILDCGAGTGLIPVALARRSAAAKITAVDLSGEMLALARRNVEASGLGSRIELRQADCKRLPFGDDSFDAVLSNSLVHHLPEPKPMLAESVRVLRPGGLLFVRDLARPESEPRVDELVDTYARGETDRQRAMFRDSLRAALTVDEVRRRLRELGLPVGSVEMTSDRHWTITARPKARGGARPFPPTAV